MLSKKTLKRENSRSTMYVIKRGKLYILFKDGRVEPVDPSKIVNRIRQHMNGLDASQIDPVSLYSYILKVSIMQNVVLGLYNRVTTVELDNLTAEHCASLTTKYKDHAVLAARIAVSNLHKETKDSFSVLIDDMYNYINPKNMKKCPMVSDQLYEVVKANSLKIDAAIDYSRDFNYNFFGFKTLEKSYLLKMNGKICERPQHLLMRVSLGIHLDDVDAAIETYNLMSEKWFTHASPTLFNSGTPLPQMSSCFLLTMKDDSIDGIFETLKQCALISKYAGGIGLSIHTIRGIGSYISGTNGESNGIIPMLRVFNNTARYVDQGGKRPGAFAIYLEPWHPDVFSFVELRKNTGAEEVRARDLFYALWVPDLFMERVESDLDWTLMDPHECPGLADCWGEEFKNLYEKYENEGKGKRTIKARELWYSIVDAQIETGTPFILYKDSCNAKSNHQHLGTIRSSNLCTEIIEYTSPDEVAVCNLASISLPTYVNESKRFFDFEKLRFVTKIITRNLNKIIDINHYPVPEAKKSNIRHRPIGIGIQGLADVFMKLRYPYDSPEAAKLNKLIFENIYYAALEASCELAKKLGPYETYPGSPVSKNILQPDMWKVDTEVLSKTSGLDWAGLRDKIKTYGIRNSLLISPMPTASTAQILGNTEAFEPLTSNIYTRRVLSGEFQIVNSYLQEDLVRLNLWSDDLKNAIIANQGSVKHIDGIPDEIKNLYKTVWEISQKDIIRMAAERAPFIDQSQSLNLYLAQPNYGKITSMHFYSWKSGLKTGMYYLRTRPAADPIKFTVDKTKLANHNKENLPDVSKMNLNSEKTMEQIRKRNEEALACSIENPEACTMCSG